MGNRNQVPHVKPWRWFQELNDKYGDVVYLQMGQTPTIVLGSAQVSSYAAFARIAPEPQR